MLQAGGDFDFLGEPLGAERGRQFGAQDTYGVEAGCASDRARACARSDTAKVRTSGLKVRTFSV